MRQTVGRGKQRSIVPASRMAIVGQSRTQATISQEEDVCFSLVSQQSAIVSAYARCWVWCYTTRRNILRRLRKFFRKSTKQIPVI